MFLISFLLVGTFGLISAQEENVTEDVELINEETEIVLEEIELPEPGSDSALENAFDRLRLAFIFNREEKINKALEIAEERLAEAESLAEENPQRAEKARERYEYFVAKAEEGLEKLENAKLGDKDLEDRFARIARIQDRIENHREKAEAVHARIINKFIERNESEEKIQRIENIFAKFEEKSKEIEERSKIRKENFKVRLKEVSEMSDEELVTFVDDIEEREGLKESREKRKIRDEKRFERNIVVREKNIERIKQRLENSNLSEEEKTRIEERISNEEFRFEEFKEKREETRFRLEERQELSNGILERVKIDSKIKVKSNGELKIRTKFDTELEELLLE